jgi:CheY-like chemotaxis protein
VADVLVVDDAPDVALLTIAVLRRAGHRVRGVESGPAALAELRGRAVDVVVLDLDMPGMDGWEVLRRVRADTRFDAVRVVVYSANRTAARGPGGVVPDRVVAKGAPPSDLVRAVAELT